jgi:hypothetical protein
MINMLSELIWKSIDSLLYMVLRPAQTNYLHVFGDVTIASEEVQNLDLHVCSVLRAFEQGGIFIMPHLL